MKTLIFLLSFFTLSTFSVNAGNLDCEIGEIQIIISPCNEAGNFSVNIDFDFANNGNEGFRVQGNGNDYGDFEYTALPITITGLEGDGQTEYEFVVIDNQFGDCSSWTAIDPVDCESSGDCFIGELSIDDYPCENGAYYVYLNFEYENVSEGFKLFIDGDLYESFSYDDLPLELGPLIGDGQTVYHFLVKDFESEGCASDANFGPIDCENGDCDIWELEANVLPCDEEGYFKVIINFEYINVGNEGFSIHGNGNDYGDFNYNDLPVIIEGLEGDGETTYEFVVSDNQFEECSNWIAIDPVDCENSSECFIGELSIDDYPCENGAYYVYLNFEYENVSNGFKLFIDGDLYESYSYDDLPLELGPFIGDGQTEYHFLVRDFETEGCASDANFGPIGCENGDCNIWDMNATILPCNDENEFNVLLNFLYTYEGNNGFTIKGNGNNYGSFNYDELPIELGPFEADGEFEYEFEARDNQYESCYDWTVVDPFLCDTTIQIYNLDLEVVNCEDDTYYLNVIFDYVNEGKEGFKITGNYLEHINYNYDDLPIQIGPLTNDETTSYYFVILDTENTTYGNWERFYPFNCENLAVDENLVMNQLISIYPNPSPGKVILQNKSQHKIELNIFTLKGELVNSFFINSEKDKTMDLPAAGMYFYSAKSSEKLESGKILIVK